MIGVETLPEKKKGEHWVFDHGVCPKFTKLADGSTDISQLSVYSPDAENKFGFEADVSTLDPLSCPHERARLILIKTDRCCLFLWLQQEGCGLASQAIKDPDRRRLDLQLAR